MSIVRLSRFPPVFFLLFTSAWPLGATAERPLKATLTESRGDVRVSGANGAENPGDWEPAEAGMTLAAGSRVKAGPDGSADLLFEDGTALHLDKGADMEVAEAREKAESRVWRLRLLAGRLFSQVAKAARPSDYRVRTPVAVAAVRGTEFVADASEDGTDLAVFDGEVQTQAMDDKGLLGEAVAVKPDQELSLERGRPAGPPTAISDAMRNFREGIAAQFRARIDGYRRDTARVMRLRAEFMERRRKRIEDSMEQRRRKDADTMRDFRKNLRRQSPQPPAP